MCTKHDHVEMRQMYDEVQMGFNIMDALVDAGYIYDRNIISQQRELVLLIAETMKSYRETNND